MVGTGRSSYARAQHGGPQPALHDLGLAVWFGGSLAGAVGFNGAAADVPDEKLRLRVANAAWRGGRR